MRSDIRLLVPRTPVQLSSERPILYVRTPDPSVVEATELNRVYVHGKSERLNKMSVDRR